MQELKNMELLTRPRRGDSADTTSTGGTGPAQAEPPQLEELLDRLRHGPKPEADAAAAALCELRPRSLAPDLLAIARQADAGATLRALSVLRAIRHPDALETAIVIASMPGHPASNEAHEFICEMAHPSSVAYLCVQTERAGSLEALERAADSRSIKLLVNAFQSPVMPEQHRAFIVRLLHRIGGAAHRFVCSGAMSEPEVVREARWEAVTAMGSAAIPHLMEALDRDADRAEFAQAALLRLGEVAVSPLIRALNMPGKGRRIRVIQVLGELGGPGVREALESMLKGATTGARRQAARALGQLGDPQAIGPLLDLLHDRNPGVRAVTALSLWHLDEIRPQMIRPLIEGLNFAGIRTEIVDALDDVAHRAPGPGLRDAVRPLRQLARPYSGLPLEIRAKCRLLINTIEETIGSTDPVRELAGCAGD